ncbi:hypothetical protein SUGI_1170530 [Cryptomeria japonica]|uniref:uncharacterized protein LOC131032447 n=1 Tax=Cryptomeria japonica TaxID=3369 RepID=UPI0024149E7D|nr:uncharacterized protein LOC131032447 [Cryptomeria japonica]GLJ54499.1 hypothetical protein SUGI_1170530 [Cryptomeria japonica]
MFSAGPSTQHHNGDKQAIEKEISDAIFSLTRRLRELKSFHNSEEAESSSNGAGVITMAGHNSGATMNIGFREVDQKSITLGHTSVHIYINNNVQGVNNSILYNSSCTLRDPGVHMDFSHTKSSTVESSKGGESEGEKMGLTADPDLDIRAKRGRSHGGRKRSLSEVLSDHDVPLCQKETQPAESCSSVNAQIHDGSSESSVQGSNAVEVTSMEIVNAENGHDRGERKPSKLMAFTRKFLCSTSVVE